MNIPGHSGYVGVMLPGRTRQRAGIPTNCHTYSEDRIMLTDLAYAIASDGIPDMLDAMLEAGATFDAAVNEIREQLETAIRNRDEYEVR